MTTQVERPRQTVLGIVKAKSEVEDGFRIELDIPSFDSQYPTLVNRVAEVLADSLKIGQQYPLILERQNLKKGKTGSKPYDYYWGLVDIAKEMPAKETNPELPSYQPDTERKERSIERQVAVKASVEWAIHQGNQGNYARTEDIILVAYKLAQFMETGRLAILPSLAQGEEAPTAGISSGISTKPQPPAERATEAPKPQPKPAQPEQRSYTYAEVKAALGMPMDEWLRANPGKTSTDAMVEVKAVRGER